MKSKFSSELAEIVGIMFGDGCMSKKHNYTYRVNICLNLKKDLEYSFYIKKMFENYLDIKLKKYISKNKSSIELYCYSKKLCSIFNKKLKIPYSPKTNLSIPNYIKSDNKLLISFLRGLFDTDGCVTIQKDKGYRYVLIKISTKHELFANSLKQALNQLKIRSFICINRNKIGSTGYDVVVRHKNAIKFFEIIGSNNQKNIKKWEKEWGRRDSNPHRPVSPNNSRH